MTRHDGQPYPLDGKSTGQSFMIRPYEPRDRSAVRFISLSTAMMGEPAAHFWDGEEVLADLLTRYHTDFEPQSSFVAEMDNNVIGYLIGALDTVQADRISFFRVIWPTFFKALFTGSFLKKKNWQLFQQVIPFALSGGYNIPDFSREYPATLHINILNGHRSLGIGAALMNAYMELLSAKKIKGIRMATMSEKAGDFFSRCGFQLLFQGRRPYFRHLIGKDVPLLVYGKILS
jgi:GNAT superfamily N-acetyltransferase